ncbi:MAG: hypothetical protein PHF00_01605 [Elusimicrobia bacterium]|nr:hypothetical protein [Elusimicrobiota bacterium]
MAALCLRPAAAASVAMFRPVSPAWVSGLASFAALPNRAGTGESYSFLRRLDFSLARNRDALAPLVATLENAGMRAGGILRFGARTAEGDRGPAP